MDGIRTNRATGATENLVREFDASEEGPAFRWEGYVFSSSNPSGHSAGEGRSLRASSSLEEVLGLGTVSTANTLIGNAGNSLALAFSNVAGAGGSPRNIGGLFMVRAHQANKRDHFLGTFLAPLVPPVTP